MRMHRKIGHGVDLGKRDIGVREFFQEFVAGQFGKTVSDRLVGQRTVANARGYVGESGIARQVGLAQHVCAELFPFALALD